MSACCLVYCESAYIRYNKVMKIEPYELAKIIQEKLSEAYKFFEIIEVRVRRDEDFDGDAIVRIDVIYTGDEKDIDSGALAGAIRRVRMFLIANEEEAFPVLSFISAHDAKLADGFARSY